MVDFSLRSGTSRTTKLAARRVDLAYPLARARQNIGQGGIDLIPGHAGGDTRVVKNIEKVLIVDVEETHLDVVIEHRPRHRGIVVDDP